MSEGSHYLHLTGGERGATLLDNDPFGSIVDMGDDDIRLIAAAVNALPELLRVYRMWMDAPEAVVSADDGDLAFLRLKDDGRNSIEGQRLRLVRDGEPGEG